MGTLRTLVSKLTGWGRDEGGADPSEFQFAPDDVRPNVWDSDIDLTLGTLVTETTTKASGRVQVMTIAHLRAELGDAWEHYKPRIVLIAETTIGRMIGKGNFFIPQDEDSWLLLMPSLSEHDAQMKADEIARVLGEKLVGQRFQEHEPPLPQHAKVDFDKALNPDGSFNAAALRASVKRARMVLASKDARRSSQEFDSTKTKALGTPTSFSQASSFPSLTLTYRPSWVSDTESFSSFALRAFTATGDPVFGPNTPPAVIASLNEATIIDLAKAAFADFTAMTGKNIRATYVLPVPFMVMTRKLGAVFLRALAALPQRERLTFMRIELVNIPLNVPVETLIGVREVFRGRVKDVAFLMDLARMNDQVLALDHVVLGAEARTDAFAGDAELHQAISTFRRRSAGRRAYVMGLRSHANAAFAVHAGLDEISGVGIADDMRSLPDHIKVLYRQDLVRGPNRAQV